MITLQDALDREKHNTLKNAISNGSLDQAQNGCLPQCISVDIRRRPISALAANSFWSGVSEIKDVLTTGNFILKTSFLKKISFEIYLRKLDKLGLHKIIRIFRRESFFSESCCLIMHRCCGGDPRGSDPPSLP